MMDANGFLFDCFSLLTAERKKIVFITRIESFIKDQLSTALFQPSCTLYDTTCNHTPEIPYYLAISH